MLKNKNGTNRLNKPINNLMNHVVEFFDLLTQFNNIELVIKLYEIDNFNIDEKLFFNNLSKIIYISSDILKKYNKKPWNYKKLSKLPKILDYAIKTYDIYDWNWNMLSKSYNITMNHILKNPHIKWNISLISTAVNKITILDILNNPQYEWNYLFCFINRIKNFNFNLDMLKKIINIFESITTVDQLNIYGLITNNSYYNNYLKQNQSIYLKYHEKSYIISVNNQNPYIYKSNKLNGIWFLNLTYLINLKYMNIECINYIITNYYKYIDVNKLNFQSPEITIELLTKYNINHKTIAKARFTFDREYYKHIIRRYISANHIIIIELASLINQYV
jgi:hypothetical protein